MGGGERGESRSGSPAPVWCLTLHPYAKHPMVEIDNPLGIIWGVVKWLTGVIYPTSPSMIIPY